MTPAISTALWAVASATGLLAAQDVPSTPVLKESFDTPNSPVAKALLRHKHIQPAPGGGYLGTDGIRVTYVGGKIGSARIVVPLKLDRSLKEASLCYDVLFEDDFQFVRGGKLHGLGPAKPVTGGNPVKPATWSSRLMFGPKGSVRIYSYHQDLRGKYGEGTRGPEGTFTKGRYHRVTLHVRLNDPPAERNGCVALYVDGKKTATHDRIRFRGEGGENTLIRRLLFSTFHGGHTEPFAPRTADGRFATVHARFDNFAVHPGLHVRRSRSP